MGINYNELAAVAVAHIDDPKNWDALAKRTALMNWLMGKGKEKVDGGLTYNWPLKLIANASQGFISGTTATVDTNPSIQLQYGSLSWYYTYFNANFTIQDYTVWHGKEEIVKGMAKKIDGAYNDVMRLWSSVAWLGSYNAAGGTINTYPLNWKGLLDMVVASGTAYGGLTDTDYASGAYLPILDTTTATPNYQNINLMLNKVKARTSKEISPEGFFSLTNTNVYSKFQTSVQNQQVFTKPGIFNAGSEGFNVNGVDMVLDADCPGTQDGSTADNYLVIFPVDIMKLAYRFGFGSKSPFDGDVQLPNQPIKSIQQYIASTMVCTNRRLIGCFKALVA